MANTLGQENITVNKIFEKSDKYDFYQLVRILKYFKGKKDVFSEQIGNSFPYFSSSTQNNFPIQQVINVNKHKDHVNVIKVSFIGLVGNKGILPFHYTEKILQTIHHGNYGLQVFFDLFNNKIISLLYSAWEKNHCYASYKAKEKYFTNKDSFGYALSSIAGINADYIPSRLKLEKELFAYYANIFNKQNKNALSLENFLSEYFTLPIKILQFHGEWLSITHEKTIISINKAVNNFQQIGCNTILGNRQWSIQHNFRIYIGPVTYDQFILMQPKSTLVNELIKLTRLYISPELSFDMQIELLAQEVPYFIFNLNKPKQLGWNTWLINKPMMKKANQLIIKTAS